MLATVLMRDGNHDRSSGDTGPSAVFTVFEDDHLIWSDLMEIGGCQINLWVRFSVRDVFRSEEELKSICEAEASQQVIEVISC